MESRIPLPTDNIYKFYALFGLLLAIFSVGASLYVNNSTNELLYEIAVDYETLKADPARSPSQEAHFKVLQSKLEISKNNKAFYIMALGVVAGIGVLMMCYGFRKWHTEVQPTQDEIARLSVKKLKQELGEDESD